MHHLRYQHITNLRRDGYRIWKIADMTGEHENTIAYVLAREGLIDPWAADRVVVNERRKSREEVKRELQRMRAHRRRANVKRRKKV